MEDQLEHKMLDRENQIIGTQIERKKYTEKKSGREMEECKRDAENENEGTRETRECSSGFTIYIEHAFFFRWGGTFSPHIVSTIKRAAVA